MAISKGNTSISKAYVGSKEVEKAFVGPNLIYKSGPDPVFANNDWATIARIVKAGEAEQYWHVGDTKTLVLTNANQYTLRIADMRHGRYTYADGTGSSNMVLECIDVYSRERMSSTGTNVGGYPATNMFLTILPNIFALFPADLKAVVPEVVVLSSAGNGSQDIVSGAAHIFLAAEAEVRPSTYYSASGECPAGQFDYYKAHTSSSDRIKYRFGTAEAWWFRSPRSVQSLAFCLTNGTGNAEYASANNINGVAFYFAL